MIGFIAILIFPLHWLLYYRPGNAEFAFALILPWVLCAFITSIIFSKSMKEGFLLPIYLGILLIVIVIILFSWAIPAISKSTGLDVTGMANSIFSGLAGLPPGTFLSNLSGEWIMVLAIVEGCLVGSAFGALAGAIRYNPKAQGYQPKAASVSPDSAVSTTKPKDFKQF